LLLVFLVLIAEASDVLQYIWGKLFGRHTIAPVLSPSKTVGGFAGGILCANALGASLWRLSPFNVLEAAAMAFLIALAGFVGGLVLSAIKRDRDLEDLEPVRPRTWRHAGLPPATTSKSAGLPFIGSALRAEFVWTVKETGAQSAAARKALRSPSCAAIIIVSSCLRASRSEAT
jgi:hypothetical protein